MASNAEKQQREANRLYWQTDLPVREIADRMEVSRSTFYRQLTADPAGERCPECATPLVYANRSAREAGEAECPECGLEQDIQLRPAASGAGEHGDGESADRGAGPRDAAEREGRDYAPRIPPGTARPARGFRTAPGSGESLEHAGKQPLSGRGRGGKRPVSEGASAAHREPSDESGLPAGMDTQDALRRARSVLLGGAVVVGVAGVLIAKLIAGRR